MKTVILFLTTIALLISCGTTEVETINATANTTFSLEGMTCETGCAKRIEQKISRMEGVKSCEVNFKNKLATVVYDDKKVEANRFVELVEDMNDGQYKAENINTEKLSSSDSDNSSSNENETGSILSAPSFELPNIMEYLRNII
ncbi:MAG: heavy metal-associated domain-containing protein [Flavobacteriales bacterium]